MGNYCCEDSNTQPQNIQREMLRIRNSSLRYSKDSCQMFKPQESYLPRKHLGRGYFGSVLLVKKKFEVPGMYAMKIFDQTKVNKANLLQSRTLKSILVEQESHFTVRIYDTFKVDHKYYVVMEYLQQGDLLAFLLRQTFDQEAIRLIASEVIEGLTYLHENSIVFQDLRPQNILVTDEGHIKLTDFVMGRFTVGNAQLLSYAGSLQYMAPQIIQYKGYNQMADLWALGILLYQLKFGITPFEADSESVTKENIINNNLEFPQTTPQVTTEYVSLVLGLLTKDPHNRMTLSSIRQHPFFRGVDWRAVRQRHTKPPLANRLLKQSQRKVLRTPIHRKFIRMGIPQSPRQHLRSSTQQPHSSQQFIE